MVKLLGACLLGLGRPDRVSSTLGCTDTLLGAYSAVLVPAGHIETVRGVGLASSGGALVVVGSVLRCGERLVPGPLCDLYLALY